jgi:ribosomal protein S18
LKKRRDFDEELNNDIDIINRLSLNDIIDFEKEKKSIINKINVWLNEPNISIGRKKFLKGWRKKESKILSYSKKRTREIQKNISNNLDIDFLKRFINNSSKILPQNIFQKIYNISLINKKEEK